MRFVLIVALILLQEKPVSTDLMDRAIIAQGAAGEIKVLLDSTLLYDGPGAKAFVEALEIPKLPGKTFVVVRVDGDERIRLLAPSLEKPISLPSTKVGAADQLSLQRETDGQTMTLTMIGTTAGKDEKVLVYEGPHAAHDLISDRDSVQVTVNGIVVYRIRRIRPAAPKPLAYTADDFAKRLNVFRKASGVADVATRAALHRSCDLHASYVAKNHPVNVHVEEAGLPGYTEEGAKCGPSSVIQYFGGKKDLRESVDCLISVIYHRQPLLHPGLKEIGVGWAWDAEGRGVVVINVSTMAAVAADPVVYPPPGAKEIPLEFALGGRESPDPLPDPNVRAGYPVTVQFDGSFPALNPKGRLLLGEKEIECWVSSPQAPARKDHPQPDLVGIIPKALLQPGKTYTVDFSCDRKEGGPWTKKWSFTTAAK